MRLFGLILVGFQVLNGPARVHQQQDGLESSQDPFQQELSCHGVFCKPRWGYPPAFPWPESSSSGGFSPLFPSALRALGLDPGWHPPGSTQGKIGRIFHDLPCLSPSSQGAAGQDGFTLSPSHHPKSHVSIRKGSSVVSSVTPVAAPRRCLGPAVSSSPVRSQWQPLPRKAPALVAQGNLPQFPQYRERAV